MVVWRICGNEVGPNGNGAAFFATKAEADSALKDYRTDVDGKTYIEEAVCNSDLPEKIVVRNRRDLANALNDAMGYGCT